MGDLNNGMTGLGCVVGRLKLIFDGLCSVNVFTVSLTKSPGEVKALSLQHFLTKCMQTSNAASLEN